MKTNFKVYSRTIMLGTIILSLSILPTVVLAENKENINKIQTNGQLLGVAHLLQKAENSVDIETSVRIAVSKHPSVKAAQQTLLQYGGEVDSAKSGRNFQFNFGLKSGTEQGNNDKDTTNAVLTVNKMLYDFGKTDGEIAYAKARERYMEATYLAQVDDIAATTAGAYLDVLRYGEYLKETEKEVAAMEHILYIVDLRARAGISSYADVVQVKTRLAAAKANLENIKMQYGQQKNRLKNYLGFWPTELRMVEPNLLTLPETDNFSLSEVPSYQQAKAEVESAIANYKAMKAQNYPVIAIQGEFGKAIADKPSSYDNDGKYKAVYFTLNEPLGGTGLSDKTKAAQNAIQAAEERVEAVLLEKEIVVSNYRTQINGYQSMLTYIENQNDNAQITKDLYLDQYMLGKRSILDILNVEQEIYQTAVQKKQLSYDINKTAVSYQKETGLIRTIFKIGNNSEEKQVQN